MKLQLWQVDAFAARPFAGNPAAVVPLQSWLPDAACILVVLR
jgi:predicted PhzF superfamily epimerase YddE/YHI9